MNNKAEYAKRILKHYFNLAIEEDLSLDNLNEIEGIVETLIAAAQAPKSTIMLTVEDYKKFNDTELSSIDNVTVILPLNEYKHLKREAHKYRKIVDVLNEHIKVQVDNSSKEDGEAYTATVDSNLILHYLLRYVYSLRNDKDKVIYEEWEYDPNKVRFVIK